MLRSILLLSLLLVASCAKDKSASASAPTAANKTMSQKFNGPPIKQNSNGEWPDEVKKYSSSDTNRQSSYFSEKSTIAKPYKTGEYTKTAWTGKTKEVSRPGYTGNTDGSRFHTLSSVAHTDTHESNTTAAIRSDAYKTGNYKTSSARENKANRLDHPSDAATDARRGVTPEPDVISWKQQRAMDVKATKSILGRDRDQ